MRLKPLILVSTLLCQGLVSTGVAGPALLQSPADASGIGPGQQMENPPRWYDDAVIYLIWVRAFAGGADHDGVGNLSGIQDRLDYLQSLGVNTLWLSPIFQCAYHGPNMHGYDTTDYYALNELFGTGADLKRLIDAVHASGMRILFDFVPNHTSTSHPWFTGVHQKSWYVWKQDLPDGWGLPWGGGGSEDVWKEMDGSYFYTAFGTGSLADLNYDNPEVRRAMQDVERYWLDRGFDGMRVDAARYLCETGPHKAADQPATHARLREFRAVLDEYQQGGNHPHPAGDPAKVSTKMMMAEAWSFDATGVGPYYGNGSDEFNLCLDFSCPPAIAETLKTPDATRITRLWEYERDHYPAGFRTASFDSNHDNLISRPGTQYGGNRNQIILAEALNLLSPGTPVIYYGNEVGMTGKRGEDLDLRQPMDWAAVTAQTPQPDSILNWCKYLIKARGAYPALRGGYATLATDLGPAKALAYVRDAGAERVVVVANLTSAAETVTITDLTRHGVAAGGTVHTIIGGTGNNETLNGTRLAVTELPPYGIRVIYAAGGAFKGPIHGDRQ